MLPPGVTETLPLPPFSRRVRISSSTCRFQAKSNSPVCSTARAAETAWRTLKRLVLDGVDDPSSALRTRVADSAVRIGESLRDDAELRDKVENWLVRAAQHLVAQYGVEITSIITETIERWDADDASRRIELHVGRDLQFIRINGTVVGALAGIAIHAVAQLLG